LPSHYYDSLNSMSNIYCHAFTAVKTIAIF
jgi:hypothetical protein